MIASVRGEVLVRRPDHVVIESGGVGYRLAVSAATLRSVPAIGDQASLHAHLIVRDDSMTIYGFAAEEERDLFLQLISVNGIGPKVALGILSAGSPPELFTAIASGDAKRFQAVPGVGKRTAERIIVELKERIAGDMEEMALAAASDAAEPRSLAREGLLGLGYAPAEAEELLASAEGDSAEELIAAALRQAADGRLAGRAA